MHSSSDAESTKIVAFAVESSHILLRRKHRSRCAKFRGRVGNISWSWSSRMTSSSSHKSSGQSSQDKLNEFFKQLFIFNPNRRSCKHQPSGLFVGWLANYANYMRVGTLKLFCISDQMWIVFCFPFNLFI